MARAFAVFEADFGGGQGFAARADGGGFDFLQAAGLGAQDGEQRSRSASRVTGIMPIASRDGA